MSGLSVSFSTTTPIPLDVSLAVAPGEFMALLGRSGSGKTTLLRSIAGLHPIPTGRVSVGDDIWRDSGAGIDLPTHHRAVGFVFQSYALFPHLTAAGNVMAAMGDVPKGQRAGEATRLLDMVGLQDLGARLPHNLSGGQQQRVAIARALARQPRVLLLDEPFSAVDRIARRRLHAHLAALRQSLTIPVILVTHDIDDALTLADRVAILEMGKIVQVGTPAEIVAAPADDYVAELVASARLAGT